MNQVMIVEGSFSAKKAGVIVSGVNLELDPLNSVDIKQFIGNRVGVVMREGSEFEAGVRKLQSVNLLLERKTLVLRWGRLRGFIRLYRGARYTWLSSSKQSWCERGAAPFPKYRRIG